MYLGFISGLPLWFFVFFFVVIAASYLGRRCAPGSTAPKAPVLTVECAVTRKRKVHYNVPFENDEIANILSFEVESGDVLDFRVSSGVYSNLKVDDVGKLTFCGSKMIKFEKSESHFTN